MLYSSHTSDKEKPLLPLHRLFPNMVTLLGLCAGLSALRYALDKKWELSVTFLVIAAFLDALDGRIARLLKATSSFGAQLDSLVDFVSFGVVPPIMLYLWHLHHIKTKGLAWAIVLFFAICMAIRLARFNCVDEESMPLWARNFFSGVPAPAGALLSLMPMMFSFNDITLTPYFGPSAGPLCLGVYILLIAYLMVSRIPTISIKKISVPRDMVSLILVSVGIFITALFIEPWITLPILGIVYLITIPISIKRFRKNQRKESL